MGASWSVVGDGAAVERAVGPGRKSTLRRGFPPATARDDHNEKREMQINIDGRAIRRAATATAAIVGVGAATFIGGQTTRMGDDARASERIDAVHVAVDKAEHEADAELSAAKLAAKAHEKAAVKKAVKRAVKRERKHAERQADQARSEGYASGNSTGYGAGRSAGYDEGNADGEASGYEDGLDDGAEPCSNDVDVDLPYCPGYSDN